MPATYDISLPATSGNFRRFFHGPIDDEQSDQSIGLSVFLKTKFIRTSRLWIVCTFRHDGVIGIR